MRWTYSIQNKLAAAGVLFGLCILVLLSNYNDRQHTEQVKEMISTLYEDRLIAEEYLFTLSSDLYEIRESVDDSSSTSGNVLLKKMEETISAYKKTKLTENEEIKFKQFEQSVIQLKASFRNDQTATLAHSKNALTLLKELSDLQLEVSKLIVNNSEKEYKLSKLLSNFAFGIAIILLLFLQALVFSSKTLHISNKKVNANLN